MEIKQRIKDNSRNTVGYVVVKEGKTFELKASDVQKMAKEISNARLGKDGEFRAKPGHQIETVDMAAKIKEKKGAVGRNGRSTSAIRNTDSRKDENGAAKVGNKRAANSNVKVLGGDLVEECIGIRERAKRRAIDLTWDKSCGNNPNKKAMNRVVENYMWLHDLMLDYLVTLQPYMLATFPRNRNTDGSDTWDIYVGLGFSMKLTYASQNEWLEITYSYKKMKRVGSAKKIDERTLCRVIGDWGSDKGNSIDVRIQKAFITQKLNIPVVDKAGFMAVAKYGDIEKCQDEASIRLSVNILYINGNRTGMNIPIEQLGLEIQEMPIVDKVCKLIEDYEYRLKLKQNAMEVVEVMNDTLSMVASKEVTKFKKDVKEKASKKGLLRSDMYKLIEEVM